MKYKLYQDVKKRFLLAEQLIKEAADIAYAHYQKKISVDVKEDFTLVTFVDNLIENVIKKGIINKFPGDGILGEELGKKESESGYIWTIDPIDGTIAYVHGIPLFSTMIGLVYDGQILYGIINFPLLKETIYAIQGKGAFWKKSYSEYFHRCYSSSVTELKEATFSTSGINYFSHKDNLELYYKLQENTKYTRTWGDAYGHMLVATGRIHIMMDCTLSVWDIVPLKIMIEEAQGCFTSTPDFHISSMYKSVRALSCANSKMFQNIKSL